MKQPSRNDQRFRLTASTVASYFKHRCDRLFRWNSVEGSSRGRSGIGWNVPSRVRSHSRPGIGLLMEAGDEFELGNIRQLIEEAGEDQVRLAGIESNGKRTTVQSLSLDSFIDICRNPPFPKYVAQIEIAFDGDSEVRFLERFGLDRNRIKLGTARPDLIELIEPEESGGRYRLRVWDFKGSQVARHEHFVQVAYYAYLLDHALREAGVQGIDVDFTMGVIQSRTERTVFELAPYLLAVDDFLRNRAPLLFDTPAADAHFHVREACAMCEYMDTCRAEAEAHYDLSRIAYMSSESKRRLRNAGVMTHRQLASLDTENGGGDLIEWLRLSSHDLTVNLSRYIATAESLEDGLPRPLETTCLLMPRYENVRIVLSAEQDAVTGSCFALGMKTLERWDAETNRPIGIEEVFIANTPDGEEVMLLQFLCVLNDLLRRVDGENREIAAQPLDLDPGVISARELLDAVEGERVAFRTRWPKVLKGNPDFDALRACIDEIEVRKKLAEKSLTEANRNARWEIRRRQKKLHFYIYDSLDLLALQRLVERHLFDTEPPELVQEIKSLIRLFPPSSLLPDADTFRSVPGTVVTNVLRTMVALPAPYVFDLKRVSEIYQPLGAEGEERGYLFRPRYGFGWEYSNQVAFERIHDVWKGESFNPDPRDPSREMGPSEILQGIEETIKGKLRATDSVVRRLKHDLGERLLLRKEPFQLYNDFDPIDFRMLDALRVFTMLEASFDELAVKHIHTLSIEDRTSKFSCIRGLRYLEGSDAPDSSLWFEFDTASRDARFDSGDFNLVLTPEDEPGLLTGEIDGKLFERAGWRFTNFKVKLIEYNLAADPPRLRLLPDNPVKLRDAVDLTKPCVLDQLYFDYNSPKVLDTLHQLQSAGEDARHVHELAVDARVNGWIPFVADVDCVEHELRSCMTTAGGDAARLLNAGQWHAWRGVFGEPLTMIWGPPGTGKTHTVAHILLGYALAARLSRRPIRILVTAFTHHAVANVLRKVAELAASYGLGDDQLLITKVGPVNPADDELPTRVGRISEEMLSGSLAGGLPCIIAGGTVWAVYKAMKKEGRGIQRWFDVVLVDEASQLRLPDALIAFSASKPGANIILAGDDQQLPPIIHGSYPVEHEHMLTSVFAFMRGRMKARSASQADAEDRMLFQLEENFRMNEPLTAYPREILYRGRFQSTKPDIRITTNPPCDPSTTDPIEAMLQPDRAAVLCWYTPSRSFTARNPVEAELVTQLACRLSEILVDDSTGNLFIPQRFASEGLALLSPHRAQNSLIRSALAEHGFNGKEKRMPLVDTVEKLQGKERDVVLVSYGVADEEYASAEAEFLLSRNRFNVAATRARHKLIVICSDTVLDVIPDDREILLQSMMLKEFRRYCSDGHLQLPWRSTEFGEVLLHVQWKGFGE